MTISLASLLTPVTEAEALDLCLSILTSLGFSATSWQSGSNARTIVQLVARLYSQLTLTIALIAGGGFNGLATGVWLTALSESHYENERIGAVATVGTLRLTASATAPIHVITASQLVAATTVTQVLDPLTQTYRNTTGGTLNPGATLDLTFANEVAGALGNGPANAQVMYLWTPLVGVTAATYDTGTGTWISTTGIDGESDARLTDRNASRWATLSYSATDGAYRNWALEADTSVTRVKVRSDNPFGAQTVDVVCATALGGITPTQETDILTYIEGTDEVGRRPLCDVVSVNSAINVDVNVWGTVRVAAAYATSTTQAIIEAAIDAYFDSLDIGGQIIPGEANGLIVFADIISAIRALPGVLTVDLSTPTANLSLGDTEIVTGVYTALVVSYV